jgi:hypothetical protein
MALTEGALPLALGEVSPPAGHVPDKVTRTLAAVGITGVTVDRHLADAADLERIARNTLAHRESVLNRVADARRTLDQLTADMRQLTT